VVETIDEEQEGAPRLLPDDLRQPLNLDPEPFLQEEGRGVGPMSGRIGQRWSLWRSDQKASASLPQRTCDWPVSRIAMPANIRSIQLSTGTDLGMEPSTSTSTQNHASPYASRISWRAVVFPHPGLPARAKENIRGRLLRTTWIPLGTNMGDGAGLKGSKAS